MRWMITLIAYTVSLAISVPIAFFAVLFLAGPHGGLLPAALHDATLLLGWLCVLFVPLLIARRAWQRRAP